MSDLAALSDFVLARLAEDAAAAARAGAESWRHRSLQRHPTSRQSVYADDHEIAVVEHLYGWHIARWDPARVLAECDAKRQIVDYARACDTAADEQPDEPFPGGSSYATTVMLRLLAAPYSGHEDFRPEWKP